MKYEYKTVVIDLSKELRNTPDEILTENGVKGWRVVAMVEPLPDTRSELRFLLERTIEDEKKENKQ